VEPNIYPHLESTFKKGGAKPFGGNVEPNV